MPPQHPGPSDEQALAAGRMLSHRSPAVPTDKPSVTGQFTPKMVTRCIPTAHWRITTAPAYRFQRTVAASQKVDRNTAHVLFLPYLALGCTVMALITMYKQVTDRFCFIMRCLHLCSDRSPSLRHADPSPEPASWKPLNCMLRSQQHMTVSLILVFEHVLVMCVWSAVGV